MGYNPFRSGGVPLSQIDTVPIALDELEPIRLCNPEEHDQVIRGA